MYPRPFDFAQPQSLPEALEALNNDLDNSKLLAGGQSLVAMLSLGIVAPSCIIDINALELGGIEQRNGSVTVGALTRHRELELSSAAKELLPLAAEAAAYIGNPRVRNRGTLGGSLSHGDPAAELAAVALAYGGRVVLASRDGERAIDIDDFLLGVFMTAARPDELLVRVELDRPPSGVGTAFVEVANRTDDYAIAGAAVLVSLDDTASRFETVRIVVIGGGHRPVHVPAANDRCAGESLNDHLLEAVASITASAINPGDDPFVSAAYRRRCAGVCAARALRAAYQRAQAAA